MNKSTFVYKYSQLIERKQFVKKEINRKNKYKSSNISKTEIDRSFHLGQLKLLMSEVLFLTKHYGDNRKVVYVGAAEGYHISYLADMFPKMTFDLWDATEFKLIKKSNMKIFNRYFEQEDAIKYSKEGFNILFMSDIRNVEVGVAKVLDDEGDTYSKIIEEDNKKQKEWVMTIKPIAAYLKFRPIYTPGKTSYFDGTIYLQPYSPDSTETRLLVTNYKSSTEYDNVEFDEKLAYFNTYTRLSYLTSKWESLLKKHKILYRWDNIYAFYILEKYLKKMGKNHQDEDIVTLFNDIIKFHIQRYKNKYLVVYE